MALAPYFYQDNHLYDRAPSATPSSATRDRLTSEIIRCQYDRFDTACLAGGDLFSIDTGFGIVTYGSIRLVPPP